MLSIGIVGLPNVGKSTLFNALTDNNVLAANYPFATIEPNIGTVAIPDKRLQKLADLYQTKRIIPATVTFVDIAGLVAGASQGEGLGNQFLSHIRTCQAIAHIVRSYDDNDGKAGTILLPNEAIDIINTELVLADLQTVQRQLPRLEKEARADPKLRLKVETLTHVQNLLDAGMPILSAQDIDMSAIADLQLITAKPTMYVFNVDENQLSNQEQKKSLSGLVDTTSSVFISAKLESELRALDAADADEMLQSYGQNESGLVQLIQHAYRLLGLQSFLTAGEKEVRAWTIPSGATAQQAAGTIHTDFSRGFIAAEIVNYHDLLACGSLSAARAAGKVRTEGKTYVMQSDDIVEFRFNV